MDEDQEVEEAEGGGKAEGTTDSGTILKITMRHINLTYYRRTRKSTLV